MYRGERKGLYVLLSRTQAGPGRKFSQPHTRHWFWCSLYPICLLACHLTSRTFFQHNKVREGSIGGISGTNFWPISPSGIKVRCRVNLSHSAGGSSLLLLNVRAAFFSAKLCAHFGPPLASGSGSRRREGAMATVCKPARSYDLVLTCPLKWQYS